MSEHLERLIVDTKESLEREMREGFQAVNARLDTQSARLERQGGLLQVGARAMSRIDAWADKVDTALEKKDREIADLRERIARLERKSA